jgi:S1-C subfamily serine protease
MASAIEELEAAATSVAAAVLPATVSIGQDHRGAGVVIGSGRVVTSAHNLRARTTQVTFGDGREVQAELEGADRAGDLAVLSVDTGDVVPLTISDSPPGLGSFVFAASRGRAGERLTQGTVTGTDCMFRGPSGHPIDGAFEHSSPLGRGSSGGPVVDRSGALVGVNTHREGSRFYLAISADQKLAERLSDLGRGDEPPTRRLGIALAPRQVAAQLRKAVGLTPRDGVLVRGVEAGSAADKAGLREGDLIVVAGGADLSESSDLIAALTAHDVAEPFELTVVRGEDEVAVRVHLDGAGPAEEGSV